MCTQKMRLTSDLKTSKSRTFGFEASNQSLILEDSGLKILFSFLFLCKSLGMFTFREKTHMQKCVLLNLFNNGHLKHLH